ncbi:MAG: conjugal transfer protein TraD [Bryobacteraceae bacterium]|nr:conjugal transfer protein TraD [Bryobacteraceae bacterium]
MQRRERTRHLIELGGLVAKAGLVDLTDDDRAVLLGGLLDLADRLNGPEGRDLLALWRRRGRRAFEADVLADTTLKETPQRQRRNCRSD